MKRRAFDRLRAAGWIAFLAFFLLSTGAYAEDFDARDPGIEAEGVGDVSSERADSVENDPAADESPAPPKAEDPHSGVDTVIVTAQKRSRRLQEVPAAATAISGQELESVGITQVQDIQTLVPNMHFGQEQGEAKITIRGVSNAQGTDQSTAVHVDSIYLNRARSITSLTFFDVQLVEVLRGPQGTLYGRNATGGTMNIISNPPSPELEAYADVQIGNYRQKMIRGMLNVPIVDDLAAVRVSGFWERRNGYQKNFAYSGSNQDADDADDFGIRSQVLLTPSDALDVTLRLNYGQKKGVGYALKSDGPLPDFIDFPFIGQQPVYAGATPNPDNDRHIFLDAKGRIDNETINANTDIEWQVPDLPLLGETHLRILGSYSDFDDRSVNDQDYSDLSISVADQSWTGDEWVGEIKWSSVFEGDGGGEDEVGDDARGSGGWLLGLFHFGTTTRTTIDAPSTLPLVPPQPPPIEVPVPFFQEFNSSAYSLAGFMNGWYQITDEIRVEAGVRYSHDWKESKLESPIIFLDTSTFVLFQPVDDDRSDDWGQPTGSISLDYQLMDASLLYARFATGYKAGTLNNDIAPIGGVLGDPDCAPDPNSPSCDGLFSPENADPETLYALEAGLKNTLFDDRLLLNGTAFIYWYEDLQVSQLFEAQNFVENAATARIWGIELESTWRPIDPLTLQAHFSYLDTSYTDYEGCRDAKDLSVQDCTNNELSRSPRFSGNFMASYELDLGSFGRITPLAQIYASDKIYFRPTNEAADAQDAYFLLNFRLMWQSPLDRLGIDLFVENALDKDVATTKIVGSSLLGSPLLDAYDRPRTIGARLSFGW